MARMIPPFYDDRLDLSHGEKKIFEQFKKLDDEYVVLHSLGIAQHIEKVFSEIDFVILCSQGILCLEVKGGFVQRRDGVWFSVNRYGKEYELKECPFKQSISAMYSLQRYLQKQFSSDSTIKRCQFACGVSFPDMPFNQKGPDIINEVVLDADGPVAGLENYIKQVFNYWRNQTREKHCFEGRKLPPDRINKIVNLLRGDFGFIPSLSYIIEKTEEKLLALTKEQFDRLAIANENPRIILKGVAGTGKTLLSFEYARRFASKGESVLYLCFNRNLSSYLQWILSGDETEVRSNLKISTFHGHISSELKNNNYYLDYEGDNRDYYYHVTLPEAFTEIGSYSERINKYDRLVIDEGQDLLKCEYVMCFDSLINGGLLKGKWNIAYDPNQNIYNDELEEGLEVINQYAPVILKLDTNCRNTKPVVTYNTLVTGISPAKYFRVDGEKVNVESYEDFSDQRRKVLKKVKRLVGQGVNPGSICLLSRFQFKNSCLRGENIFNNFCALQDITDIDPRYYSSNSIKFSTIHSFKGLEAAVVFVLDIESIVEQEDRHLNYVAFSRAKSLLCFFYNKSVEQELVEIMNSSAALLNDVEFKSI